MVQPSHCRMAFTIIIPTPLSVDGLSRDAPSAGSLAGQPRLLIPIILALGYNRFNTLAAEEVGVTLQLLPMLVGFFTYKGAVVVKTSTSLWYEMTASLRGEEQTESAPREAQAQEGDLDDDAGDHSESAMKKKQIEKAYLDKVLTR